MKGMYGILTVPFGVLHARFEALVGRPVWTHELVMCKDELIAEARCRACMPKTPDQLIQELVDNGYGDKLIVVDVGNTEPAE